MRIQRTKRLIGWLASTAIAVTCLGFDGTPRIAAAASGLESLSGGAPLFRRLSGDQYRQIIADLFGPTIKLGGSFEPDVRMNGLLAVGASQVSISSTGLDLYDASARTVAAQVVSDQYRAAFVLCTPAAKTAADDGCALQFIAPIGRALFRRPLSERERDLLVKTASNGATSLKDFYAGLELSLTAMLNAPQFLFRHEVAEPDPANPGQSRLNAFSKATRLSFLLWNTAPDPELLDAAERGDLHAGAGLERQVDRMLKSPRVEDAARAFFTDMLNFDAISNLQKDATIYPRFSTNVAKDAQEQTLRTIVDLLVKRQGDYRDLFTTTRTFLTPTLGRTYGLPVARSTPNGEPDPWVAFEYPEGDPRAGILSQVSFVALHSHPGRSSPTLRGKALREIFFCQKVPDPPGNVAFTIVQDTTNPIHRTARERLSAHATESMCTGCHKIIDPLGLALENFDSAGGYRSSENGVPIDSSGVLNGAEFKDTAGLRRVVHDSPLPSNCLVERVFSYAVGRAPSNPDMAWIADMQKIFGKNGYKFPALLKQVATSRQFYGVSTP